MRPKHLRIVIAAVQAMLDPELNHGLHATTMGATPLIVEWINVMLRITQTLFWVVVRTIEPMHVSDER